MALLPAIPERPALRPETLAEYRSRRAVIAMHRQARDDSSRWVRNAVPERIWASGLLSDMFVPMRQKPLLVESALGFSARRFALLPLLLKEPE